MKAIKAGLLIDGTGKGPTKDVTVLVEKSTIKAILTKPDSVAAPREAEIIDVSDYVLLPGFIDVHVHLRNPCTMTRENFYKYAVETESHMRVFHAAHSAHVTFAAGFTTLRNMGGMEFVSLRKAIDGHLIPGPRILTSGLVLMTGGHTDNTRPRTLPRGGEIAWKTADGVDAVRKLVREHVFDGADFIKFETTGGLHLPDKRGYSRAEIEAIVDEAHGLGVKAVAHAHGKEGILRAVEAGVDTLEHGTFMDEECIEKMVQFGTVFVPTLAIMNFNLTHGREFGYSDEYISKYMRLQNIRMEAVRKVHAAGVPIALGTDSSYQMPPHGENAIEFKLLAEAGLSPSESIKAGTGVAAKAIDLDNLVGTIEPGKRADMVVVRSNPLDDLSILQNKSNILKVIKDGSVAVDRLTDHETVHLKWPIDSTMQ